MYPEKSLAPHLFFLQCHTIQLSQLSLLKQLKLFSQLLQKYFKLRQIPSMEIFTLKFSKGKNNFKIENEGTTSSICFIRSAYTTFMFLLSILKVVGCKPKKTCLAGGHWKEEVFSSGVKLIYLAFALLFLLDFMTRICSGMDVK